MSIRRGNKIIASRISNGFSLFDCKWADHVLNNISWLRADTFSWQSGNVYKAAYEHLVGDFGEVEILYCWGGDTFTKTPTPKKGDATYKSDGSEYLLGSIEYVADDYSYIATGAAPLYRDSSKDLQLPKEKSPQTDTIGDITITYYLADDGHKICVSDNEANVQALYEKTGVAWYYILDIANKQFKLPRTKFGFTGIRSGVGGYVEPGLPNITGAWSSDYNITLDNGSQCIGAISAPYSTGTGHYGGSNAAAEWGYGFKFDASRSNSIYGNSETVQQPATQMYLYFYVGNYVENETTVDVGKLTEIVNDFDIDTFKPQVDEVKNDAIVDISDAKTDAIDSLTNLATDLGSSLKYGNVGDIFYTSRLDVSLNGAVECNGNLYNTTDFGGSQSIGNLLSDHKVPYISLAEHQTTVDTYGSCRCFGWDGGNEFRVPKLADVFIEAGTAASEGEFITAGLPNITGGFNVGGDFESKSGAFNGSSTGFRGADNGGSDGGYVRFSAANSNAIYGNSTTVQPPAVRYRAMVQLAFGATDDAVVTVGNMVANVADLNSHRVIEFQAPTSANNYTWYRKYADGWVEQGGLTNTNTVYTLPVTMRDTNYYVSVTWDGGKSANFYPVDFQVRNLTTTSFFTTASRNGSNVQGRCWEVKGMYAQ